MRITKIFTGVALAVTMLFTTTACSTTEPIDASTATAIIDVRTVEEFNAGHLEGAQLGVHRGPLREAHRLNPAL
mgnify:CR=1 FL=1